MTERNGVITDFLERSGCRDMVRRRLAGDASFRRYDRLSDGERRLVLMDAPPPQEDVRPFLGIANHLVGLGYSAPCVLAADADAGLLLLEDLGDDTYTRRLAAGDDEAALYRLAVDVLIDLHSRADAVPPGLPSYDDARLLTEAALLVDWYLPEVLGRPATAAERSEYLDLWRALLPLARAVPDSIVLRDFHVDNLMLLPRPGLAACGLLDFQDAVAGPVTYDLMSLLEDARRDVPAAVIAEGRARYRAAFPSINPVAFAASWAVLAAQRHAKVIGIFTRLCRRDGKPHYLGHIPRVWRLFETALRHPALAALRGWVDHHLPPDARIVPTCRPAA